MADRLKPHPTNPNLVVDLDTHQIFDRRTRQPINQPQQAAPEPVGPAPDLVGPRQFQGTPMERMKYMSPEERELYARNLATEAQNFSQQHRPLGMFTDNNASMGPPITGKEVKDIAWDSAMMAGPAAGVKLATKVMRPLDSVGAFPALGRAAFGAAPGGAVASLPFGIAEGDVPGKAAEGAAVGGAGALVSDLGMYGLRGLNWLLKGGAKGIMRNFVNAIGERTGLGKDLSKTGADIVHKIGGKTGWKEQFYEGIYKPLNDQVRTLWPQGTRSNMVRKIYDAGHGQEVLPKPLFDVLEDQSKAAAELKEILAERQKAALYNKNFQQVHAGNQEMLDAQAKAFQAQQLKSLTEEQYLRSLPRYQNVGQDPEVSFEQMQEIYSHLRNHGYSPAGERTGTLSAESRAAAFGVKDEMSKVLGKQDQGLTDQWLRARDHAFGWETLEKLIADSGYTSDGPFPKINQVQEAFIKYNDQLKDAFGDEFRDILNQTVFGGRTDLNMISRPWGGMHGHLHASPGHAGSRFLGSFAPPLPARPDMTTWDMVKQYSIPGAILGPLTRPQAEEEPLDRLRRYKQEILPSDPSSGGLSSWLPWNWGGGSQ